MRHRLDFVPPGMVAGQITRVAGLAGNTHPRLVDGPDGSPTQYRVAGIDTAITLAGHPFVYSVAATTTRDGPRITELYIHSPDQDVPITGDDLRKVARYLDRLAWAATVGPDVATPRFHQPEKPMPKRPGRHGHGHGHYAEVAEMAKAAHQAKVSARERIAAHYGVSKDTADKYLARARKAGFLKPGELGGKPRTTKTPTDIRRQDTN